MTYTSRATHGRSRRRAGAALVSIALALTVTVDRSAAGPAPATTGPGPYPQDRTVSTPPVAGDLDGAGCCWYESQYTPGAYRGMKIVPAREAHPGYDAIEFQAGQRALHVINNARHLQGLPGLAWSDHLYDLGRRHLRRIADGEVAYEHPTNDWRELYTTASFIAVENLAGSASPQGVLQDWWADGHYAALMRYRPDVAAVAMYCMPDNSARWIFMGAPTTAAQSAIVEPPVPARDPAGSDIEQIISDADIAWGRTNPCGLHTPDPPPEPPGTATTTHYTPVAPTRLADTRGGGFGYQSIGACTVRVPVAGVGGVPDTASAAALTITVPDASVGTWASVWPAGTPWSSTSTLNVGAGETRANSAIVQLGTDGAVQVYSPGCGDVLVDVTGAFTLAASARSGRFVPVGPARVMDGPVAVGHTATLTPQQLGVPATATAVAVNVTVGGSQAAGYLTAYPAGSGQPDVSMLNTDSAGQTRAASAVIPLSAAGMTLWQNIGGRFVVDIAGYFTGADAPNSTDGLFVPQVPGRALDTRASGRLVDGEWRFVGSTGSAIAANWTIDDASGWLAAAPLGAWTGTSTVNGAGPGAAVANFGIIPSGDGIAVRAGDTATGANVIVDIFGWFT